MNAWLSNTFTSRHKLCTEAVGTWAKNTGFTASVTSTMDNPLERPNNTNSR